MNKFVIISDSCCDLSKELREKYDIDYIPMYISCDGKEYKASLDWEEISMKDFYGAMHKGKRFMTAQITAAQYTERFESYLTQGYDVLSLSCSAALSNSVKTSFIVRDQLAEKYPDRKIICMDSLNACMALGLLCIRASELRAEGKTIEETAQWITDHRLTVNQECTVESLRFLKMAGRVSAASAFFGGLLSVKPIIISDVNGQNTAVEKVKGRLNSIKRIAERVKDEYRDLDYQNIYVVHADGEEDALVLEEEVRKVLPEGVKINRGLIGPIVGATTGPGTLAVYLFGKTVEFDSKK
ncbi:MAG: DegV family protein [Clostridia bacterium]|nr:DegV family protein [Clostridia bacterium]